MLSCSQVPQAMPHCYNEYDVITVYACMQSNIMRHRHGNCNLCSTDVKICMLHLTFHKGADHLTCRNYMSRSWGATRPSRGVCKRLRLRWSASLPNWLPSSVRHNRSDRHSEEICFRVGYTLAR